MLKDKESDDFVLNPFFMAALRIAHYDLTPFVISPTMARTSRQKRLDHSNQPEALTGDKLTKHEIDQVRPDLRSLVFPWLLIALCAVSAAAWSTPSLWSSADNAAIMEAAAADEESSSWLDRLLQVSNFQSHSSFGGPPKPVYNEDHEPLFPLSERDIIGLAFTILGLMVAAGGGIGGGGIIVPIYILILGFSPKHAIPLSNVTVLGGALANTVLNADKRHPLVERPLIDWDLILVMEPLTIAGALIGAFLNKLLPERLLVVMLVALLSFTAYTTLQKAVKMYKIESRHLREKGMRPDGSKESELTAISVKGQDESKEEAADILLKHIELQDGEIPGDGDGSNITVDGKIAQELAQILEEEKHVPMAGIMILVVMFIVVLTINILKGGGAFPSPLGIKCGSKSFWMANALMLGWLLFISIFVRSYLVRRYETKKRVGYEYVEGDIQWDSWATIVYPSICCFAGLFAGMFGIGGGIVKGPLMLAMGVHPAVSSASSACMILFTSFTATTSFIVFGLLVPDYSAVCFVVGFLSTYVGQLAMSYVMNRAQRNSYIAFSIGGVVLLSAFLMTIQSLLSTAEGEHHKSGGICGHDS